ncbi:hypothetical protein V8C40DRAFT_226110 [Trichoderma camerunense]
MSPKKQKQKPSTPLHRPSSLIRPNTRCHVIKPGFSLYYLQNPINTTLIPPLYLLLSYHTISFSFHSFFSYVSSDIIFFMLHMHSATHYITLHVHGIHIA